VVAADCDFGPREIVRDGETGLLARADDAESLAAAIRRVLSDPALGQRLVVRGRRRALDFDAPAIGDRYADLVHEAASLVRDKTGREYSRAAGGAAS
jgi:glycosyltransferase involved in cell wall biosynthesis